MASPQTENGFTRIANELLSALSRAGLSSRQWDVISVILRESYGWNRKETRAMSIGDIAMACGGISKGSIHLALAQLVLRKMVVKSEGSKWAINKDHETWVAVQPTERKEQKIVQPTERYRSAHRTVPFSPLNDIVQPTERPIRCKDKRQLKTVKERTGIQVLIDAYLAEYIGIIPGQDNKAKIGAIYSRYSRDAKAILDILDNDHSRALKAMRDILDYAKEKKWENCSLGTVAKKALEYEKNPAAYYVERFVLPRYWEKPNLSTEEIRFDAEGRDTWAEGYKQ